MNIIDVFLNCSDSFRENMRANSSTYNRFTPIFLFGHDDFKKAYISSLANIPFRLWIHLEYRDPINDSLGFQVAQGIKEDFPLLKLQFITRKTTMTELNGHKIFLLYNEGDFKWSTYDFELIPINNPNLCVSSNSEIAVKHSNIKDNIEKFEFSILTALIKDEYHVFKKHLVGNKQNGAFIGKFKDSSENEYKSDIVLIHQNKMGMVDASLKTIDVLNNFNPSSVILAGVCGGRRAKVKLYDIIIPEQIIDIVTGKFEDNNFTPYGYFERLNEDLIAHLKEVVEDENFIKQEMYNLIPNDIKYNREKEILREIEIHFDTMACGPFVLKTDNFLKEKAKDISDKIVGFEMESYGVIRAVTMLKKESLCLVVKSVMDYTDEKKKDVIEGEDVKLNAAYMSYICTRALIPHIKEYLDFNLHSRNA